MEWNLDRVERCASPGGGWQPIAKFSTKVLRPAIRNNAVFDLTLKFNGPFLVNDASRGKPANYAELSEEEKRRYKDFNPLLRADGSVWLPASSFRGVLRSRAEFLARSLGKLDSIPKIFGDTGHAARLLIEEFKEVGRCVKLNQDFVAIDRFTGGAAAGAKFDAVYADRPTFTTRMTLELTLDEDGRTDDEDGLTDDDLKLFAMVLRDVCEGRVTFGFGAAKGYGEASGELKEAAWDWVMDHLEETRPQETGAATPAEEGLTHGELRVARHSYTFSLQKFPFRKLTGMDRERI